MWESNWSFTAAVRITKHSFLGFFFFFGIWDDSVLFSLWFISLYLLSMLENPATKTFHPIHSYHLKWLNADMKSKKGTSMFFFFYGRVFFFFVADGLSFWKAALGPLDRWKMLSAHMQYILEIGYRWWNDTFCCLFPEKPLFSTNISLILGLFYLFFRDVKFEKFFFESTLLWLQYNMQSVNNWSYQKNVVKLKNHVRENGNRASW